MSNLFSRIGIGCSNWNQEYNGSKLSDTDIDKILGYCLSAGVDLLDMATAYDNDFSRPNSFFHKVIKVQNVEDVSKIVEYNPYCIMAHGEPYIKSAYSGFCTDGGSCRKFGTSIYNIENCSHCIYDVVQVPYSLYDRRFEPYFRKWKEDEIELHVRSVFLRGKILQDGVPAEECIKFCLCNPNVDRVIIGVDSVEQLQRNLDFLWKWQGLEKHDLDLIDPRRWGKESK